MTHGQRCPTDDAPPDVPQSGGRSRRLAAAGVVGALALLTAGCSTALPAEPGVTTLELTAQTGLQEILPGILARWDEQNPGIRVVPTYVSDVIPIERIQLQGNQAADLITVFPGDGSPIATRQLSAGGFLEDLSDQDWVSRVSDSSLEAMSSADGEVLMFSPFSVAVGTFYNKRVFADLGVDVPATWDDVLAACDVFNEAGVTPFALGAQTTDVTQLINYALVPTLVDRPDPDFADRQQAGEASFSDSGWRAAFTKYEQLADRGCFQDGFNGTTADQAITMLGTGEAAMSVLVSASAPDLAQYDDLDNFAMFPLPATDDPDETWGAVALGAGIGVNASGDHVEEAKRFVGFLAEEESIAAFSDSPGRIPVIQGESVAVDPITGAAYNPLITAEKTAAFPDQRWPGPIVQSTHWAMVQRVLAGRGTVAGALAQMDEAYDQ